MTTKTDSTMLSYLYPPNESLFTSVCKTAGILVIGAGTCYFSGRLVSCVFKAETADNKAKQAMTTATKNSEHIGILTRAANEQATEIKLLKHQVNGLVIEKQTFEDRLYVLEQRLPIVASSCNRLTIENSDGTLVVKESAQSQTFPSNPPPSSIRRSNSADLRVLASQYPPPNTPSQSTSTENRPSNSSSTTVNSITNGVSQEIGRLAVQGAAHLITGGSNGAIGKALKVASAILSNN